MYTDLVALCAFIVIQETGWLITFAPTLANLAHDYIRCIVYRCYGNIRSASWLRRVQIISLGQTVAMHAAVLGWGMTSADLPIWIAVMAAIGITTGWMVIACAAVAQMVAHFQQAPTPEPSP